MSSISIDGFTWLCARLDKLRKYQNSVVGKRRLKFQDNEYLFQDGEYLT